MYKIVHSSKHLRISVPLPGILKYLLLHLLLARSFKTRTTILTSCVFLAKSLICGEGRAGEELYK